MIKYSLVLVLMMLLLGVTQRLAILTYYENIETLQWIEKGQAKKGSANEQKYFSSYSYAYINALKNRLTQENIILVGLKQSLLLALLTLLIIYTFIICFTKATIKKNDGLALLLFAFALIGCLVILINFFYTQFEQASAATNDLEVSIHVALIIISPLLFLVAGLLHNKEIGLALQHSKWIAYIAFGLFMITALFALFMWFASNAFDLGGSWG